MLTCILDDMPCLIKVSSTSYVAFWFTVRAFGKTNAHSCYIGGKIHKDLIIFLVFSSSIDSRNFLIYSTHCTFTLTLGDQIKHLSIFLPLVLEVDVEALLLVSSLKCPLHYWFLGTYWFFLALIILAMTARACFKCG